MDFSWMDLLASFGAGIFGAAIGALPAFILMGLFIVAGTMAALAGVALTLLIPGDLDPCSALISPLLEEWQQQLIQLIKDG